MVFCPQTAEGPYIICLLVFKLLELYPVVNLVLKSYFLPLQLLGHDLGVSDYDGRTALHLAAAEGHLACVTFLLNKCHVPHSPVDR